MKKAFAFLVKAAVSAALLYFALRATNFVELQQRLARMDFVWAALALAVMIAQTLLLALRWRIIAEAAGAHVAFPQLAKFLFIGTFFNQTLPSTIGGDAARIVLLGRSGTNWKSATYSVLVDRAAGLIWLALIVLACLPWSLRLIQNPVGRAAIVIIGAAGVIGPVVLYAATRLLQPALARWRATRHAAEIVRTLWSTLLSARTGFPVAALSIAIHVLTAVEAWMLAQSVGIPLTLLNALILMLPVILISAVPISIAGWGVRENALATAFAYARLPVSDGITVSLLLGIGLFIVGLIGGGLWIVSGQRRMSAETPLKDA